MPGSSYSTPNDLRYGMMIDLSAPLPGVVDQVRSMADAGMASALTPHVSCFYDALTLLAVAGAEVPDIELVAGVVPILPHHPVWLAAQALTVQAVVDGRLTLGVGFSGRLVTEQVFGLSYEHPAQRMREYLTVLYPLLNGQPVAFQGETVQAVAPDALGVPAAPPPLLVGAVGPRMLDLAGSLADGAVTWLAGPRTLADHVTPRIVAAAERAGRPCPRLQVVLPACVTNDPAEARAEADRAFGIYANMPHYRAALDREGAVTVADVALIGDEETVAAGIARVAAAGATDFTAVAFGSPDERRHTFSLVTAHAQASTASRAAERTALVPDSPAALPFTVLHGEAR